MTGLDTTRAAPSRPRPAARATLTPRWRKLLLAVHVTGSVGLLGSDAAVLTLAVAGWAGANPITVYPAAHRLGVILILPLALIALCTGVIQALLTRWGLTRYWWVLIKLALTVAGTILALFVLLPDLHSTEAAALAGRPVSDRFSLVQDACGASVVLVVTVLLAYYKPFGPIRPTQRPQAQALDTEGKP